MDALLIVKAQVFPQSFPCLMESGVIFWKGVELRLRAALERLSQRAKEGQTLPRSASITHAGARLPQSP